MKSNVKLFLGPTPQVGKTFICRKLAAENNEKSGSTSDIVIERTAIEMAKIHPECINIQNTINTIKKNKEEFRWLLEAVGDRICKNDPTALAGVLIERGINYVDGIRRFEELKAILKKYSDTTIYWIERPDYKVAPDNTDLTLHNIMKLTHDIILVKNKF